MKTHTRYVPITLAVLIAAITNPLSSAPSTKPAAVHPVGRVLHSNGSMVVRGDTTYTVQESLGIPARKLDANVWIYPRYDGGSAQSRGCDCSTLVVTFKNDQVSNLQLVNDRAVAVLAKQVDTNLGTNLFASLAK